MRRLGRIKTGLTIVRLTRRVVSNTIRRLKSEQADPLTAFYCALFETAKQIQDAIERVYDDEYRATWGHTTLPKALADDLDHSI